MYCSKCGSASLAKYLPQMPEVAKCAECGVLHLVDLTEAELKTLRAKINGKLGRRTISPEAQAKMQAARKKRNQET